MELMASKSIYIHKQLDKHKKYAIKLWLVLCCLRACNDSVYISLWITLCIVHCYRSTHPGASQLRLVNCAPSQI